jgi:hypothetical protein
MTATALLVVPRSMPITLAILLPLGPSKPVAARAAFLKACEGMLQAI